MLIKKRTSRGAIFIVICFLFAVWLMTYPIGCSWNKDSIPAESSVSSGKVTLSWDEIHGATSYNVYFSSVPGVPAYDSYKIENAADPITIVDLRPGVTYYFAVTVVDHFGEGEKSKEASYRVTDREGFIKIESLLAPEDLKIFFDTDSTKLSKSEIEKLDRFAKYVLGVSNYEVKLDGYTDPSGDIEHNRVISENRAAAVKSYLVRRGVAAEYIATMGHGAENFISGNDTGEGRKMNRRVEIKFTVLDENTPVK
jgi:outer membrane protein OmpA-like peptidoglycan-associated protein